MEAYTKKYIIKKRLRLAAAICSVICLIFVGTYTAISFIGQKLGNYTITAKGDKREISMSVDKAFTSPTTFLKANSLSSLYLIYADDLPVVNEIDNSTLSGDHSGSRTKLDDNGNVTKVEDLYFAYTFYVKNIGSAAVNVANLLKLEEVKRPSNVATSILEYVRIRTFENLVVDGKEDTHSVNTYAKRTNKTTTENQGKELICDSTGYGLTEPSQEVNRGYATEFYSDDYVYNTTKTPTEMAINSIYRYTVIMWLEGSDPDAIGVEPEGSALRFALTLEAL
jgi:hypothetical protein